MSKINPIEAVILAGGQSRRMGEDKARLLVGRRSLLGHARALAADLGLACRVVRVDRRADNGPMGGIETALRRAQAERVLFLSCDMPFLNPTLVERVLAVQHPAVFAEADKLAGFPFCISPELLTAVEASLETGDRSLQSFSRRHGRRGRITQRECALLANINTELNLAAERAGR